MKLHSLLAVLLSLLAAVVLSAQSQRPAPVANPEEPWKKLYKDKLNVNPPPISTDKAVKYDYDIVYVRAPRGGDTKRMTFTEVFNPGYIDAGADLMLLHPDGKEEVLVKGGEASITDPMISLDGEWVYYVHLHVKGGSPYYPAPQGSDIYKLHLKTRKIVRLTRQEITPNTGAANWSKDIRAAEPGKTHAARGVLNMGPCPLPGGKLMFTSSRNYFQSPKHSWPAQQLFVLDEETGEVECVGHLNLGMRMHPVVLKDGRVMFSSLENQGLRQGGLWGLWTIHPDGTNWNPLWSAFNLGMPADSLHFQTQIGDGHVIACTYYNLNDNGMGPLFKIPVRVPEGTPWFGPGDRDDPRNPWLRGGRFDNGMSVGGRNPFSPYGIEALTPFVTPSDSPAGLSVIGDPKSPRVGKFTHPSGAPDNHLLAVWSPGPVQHRDGYKPVPDTGLYLVKESKPFDEPGQMLLIKNDPNYNEQWPRAVVSYERIYGVKEPARLPTLKNDGTKSRHLPEGTPFGLVGTSSFYKRESFPNGSVPKDGVTAGFSGTDRLYSQGYGGLDPFNTNATYVPNWNTQGADAGKYFNDDIHAVRIIAMEPTTDRHNGPKYGRQFYSHASERLRILGEIPVRKFNDEIQPTDPDGNPDTSFLARIPADMAWSFQLLDKRGMMLTMAQTWHQLRPGEIRNDCGGCHAHSQKPTDFKLTAAAKPDYAPFDLTGKTPLLTTKKQDESGKQWDAKNETGLRFQQGVKNVEFFRDIKPILDRSCAACHSHKLNKPAANLVLDDDRKMNAVHHPSMPTTYYNLAADAYGQHAKPRSGYKPVHHLGHWFGNNASRFVRKFQSRRSLLVWKIHGERTDGWTSDDFPTETSPGDITTLKWKGKPVGKEQVDKADLDYTGSIMPPPEAVKTGKVKPLTDEDRLSIVRWIDLGCPIDLDFDPAKPQAAGFGWMLDDNRPTLTVAVPRPRSNDSLTKLVVGMHDYGTGLDPKSFSATADFAVDDVKPGEDLAAKFKARGHGVWELALARPIEQLTKGVLTVAVKDRQGNVTRVERTFSVRQER